MKTLQKWIILGTAEILLSLFLMASAPRFLNSDKPMLGFLIWLAVPTLLGGSSVYIALKLANARKSRQLFITKFPEYADIGIMDFLEVFPTEIAKNLEMFAAIKNEPDFQELGISPLDLLRGSKKQ